MSAKNKENKFNWYLLISFALFFGIIFGYFVTSTLSTIGQPTKTTLPDGPRIIQSAPTMTECNDNRDNDNDGLCDYDGVYTYPHGIDPALFPNSGHWTCVPDPGCLSLRDESETQCMPITEICNGLDDDCDGVIDDGDVCANQEYYCDSDSDTYKSISASGTCSIYNCVPQDCLAISDNDCDDTNPSINPEATEYCDNDGIDNDCDGIIDECVCNNGVFDSGYESDIDCGYTCPPCQIGQACSQNSDCESNSCFYGTCVAEITYEEIYPGLNDQFANRVNVVFVPINFSDMDAFINAVKQSLDYNSTYTNYGLLELPVYVDNKTKFNFWYINRSFPPMGNPSLSCPQAGNDIATLYCNDLPNRYMVYIANMSFNSCAYFDGASYNSIYQMPLCFPHEFQHQFPTLADEYTVTGSTVNHFADPNCAPNLSTARSWWRTLAGTTVDGQLTGYYNGCSYIAENIRPTENSIMRSNVPILGAVNQREINDYLSAYTGLLTSTGNIDAVEITLTGNPGYIDSFVLSYMDPIILSSKPTFKTNQPYKLKLKAKDSSKIYGQENFNIYNYLLTDDFSGEELQGTIKEEALTEIKVIISLDKGIYYNKSTNMIIDNGISIIPEIEIENIKEMIK